MIQDTAAAVAGLHAAGDDTEALSEAIEKAAFLDVIPGDDRQKLRGKLLHFPASPRAAAERDHKALRFLSAMDCVAVE